MLVSTFAWGSMLARHLLRSLWALRWRLATIGAIAAACFGMLVGAYSAVDRLFERVESTQSAAAMAELELIVAPEDPNNLPSLDKLPGVRAIERRLLSPGVVELGAQHSVAALFIAADAGQFSRINRLTLLSGSNLADTPQGTVIVERNCASHYGVRPGDRMRLRVGHARYALVVGGVAQSPEYLVAPQNPGVYVPSSGSLCVMFGHQQLLHEQLGFAAFNSLLFQLQPGVSAESVRAAVLELATTRLTVEYALTRSEQFSQKFLELDLNTFRLFLPAVVAIFALTALVVTLFLMSQWVHGERPTIAMLQTLGHPRRRILAAYCMPGGAILLIALVLGVPMALFDLWAFGSNYAQAIGMPAPEIALSAPYLALGTALVATLVALGLYAPMRSVWRVAPVLALRGAGSELKASATLGEVSRLGGPFWWRYALRNLIGRWRVSAISVAAVAASLAVTMSFFIAVTSMERTAIDSFERDRWHAVVDLDTPWWSDELGRLDAGLPLAQWSGFVRGGAQARAGGGRIDNVNLLGVDPAADVRTPTLLSGRGLQRDGSAPPAAGTVMMEAVVERRLAVDHDLRIGGVLNLVVRGQEHALRVVGIHSSAIPAEVIVARAAAQRMLDLHDQFTGVFLLAPQADPGAKERLLALPGVVRVTSKQDMVDTVLTMSRHIWEIVHVAAGLSIVVAALFLLASTRFAIVSRSAEYGLLRSLGHPPGTIRRIVLAETMVLSMAGALLAMPLALVLGHALNARLTEAWFMVRTAPAASDFLSVVVPALILLPLVALPSVRTVLALPLVEALKHRNYA